MERGEMPRRDKRAAVLPMLQYQNNLTLLKIAVRGGAVKTSYRQKNKPKSPFPKHWERGFLRFR